jgi:hypothetical protein
VRATETPVADILDSMEAFAAGTALLTDGSTTERDGAPCATGPR